MAPIRLGWVVNTIIPQGLTPPQYWNAVQRQLDLVGPYIDSLWMVDHLQFGDLVVLEGWTGLTYLCATYPQFPIGHMVLCQSFRNPALLAKMGATLQYLSRGRFTFAIGSGWNEEEYRAYGYPFPTAGARVDQLEETLQIVRALWTEQQVTYQGRYYAVTEAYCEPKPDPVPPILLAAHGPRSLGLVARYADGWNVYGGVGPEDYREKVELLEEACRAIGRDPGQIERSWCCLYACRASREEAAALIESQRLRAEHQGTPEQIVEQLQAYVQLGVESFMLGSSRVETTTVELLAREVLPSVRR